MTDYELLLDFSEMLNRKLDEKLITIENHLKRIEDMLEKDVLSRLNTIETCYMELCCK